MVASKNWQWCKIPTCPSQGSGRGPWSKYKPVVVQGLCVCPGSVVWCVWCMWCGVCGVCGVVCVVYVVWCVTSHVSMSQLLFRLRDPYNSHCHRLTENDGKYAVEMYHYSGLEAPKQRCCPAAAPQRSVSTGSILQLQRTRWGRTITPATRHLHLYSRVVTRGRLDGASISTLRVPKQQDISSCCGILANAEQLPESCSP